MTRKTSYLETILGKKKRNIPVIVKERKGEKEHLKVLSKIYLDNSLGNNQRMKFLLQKF